MISLRALLLPAHLGLLWMLAGCYGGQSVSLTVREATVRIASSRRQETTPPASRPTAEQAQVLAIVEEVTRRHGLSADPMVGFGGPPRFNVSFDVARFGGRSGPQVNLSTARAGYVAIVSVLVRTGAESALAERLTGELQVRLDARFGATRVAVRRDTLANSF